MTSALLLLAVGLCSAASTDSAAIVGAIRAAVDSQARAVGETAVVESVRLPRLSLPEGVLTFSLPGLPAQRLRGPIAVMVEVADAGKPVQRIPVSLTVRTFAEVVVTNRRVDRHESLDAGMLEVRRMETTRMASPVVRSVDGAAGHRARRILNEGTVLTEDLLEPLPAVRQGDAVTLIVRERGVRLSMKATARQDGLPGTRIEVQPSGSRGRLRGVVVDATTVECIADGR